MYERKYKSERILVICSFNKESMSYRLPKGYDPSKGQLLLDNYIAEKDMDSAARGSASAKEKGGAAEKRPHKSLTAGVMRRLKPYEVQVWKY